jgi:alpha-glucosidase
LIERAHARGLRVILDYVPCHTSIEHPWFRTHPDRYVWTDKPNNWRSFFGTPAWTLDSTSGRYYLHSFYREQPDLNWHNPEVVRAMTDVLRFWLARGVDGFRIDAICRLLKDEQLRDDPPARAPLPFPTDAEYGKLDHVHSSNHPQTGALLAQLREAAGDTFLIGELGVLTSQYGPYLEYLDCVFGFETFFAAWQPAALRKSIEDALAIPPSRGKVAWVLSNHDYPRIATRVGRRYEHIALLLLLTLPGICFVYQGEELGLLDGHAAGEHDRFGRDGTRCPIPWNATANGGFTDGVPWLPVCDPSDRNVAQSETDPNSLLAFHRRVMALRHTVNGPLTFLDLGDDVLAYRRGRHVVMLNFGDTPHIVGAKMKLVVASDSTTSGSSIAPCSGAIFFTG